MPAVLRVFLFVILTFTAAVASATGLSLSINPSTIAGGESSIGTVTLGAPAPSGGATIVLSTNNPGRASIPASIIIPQGQTQGVFAISAPRQVTLGYATIKATYGAEVASALLTVDLSRWKSLTFEYPAVWGGTQNPVAYIQLYKVVTADLVAQVTSSNADAVIVPDTVTVPAGYDAKTFIVETNCVSSETPVVITVSFAGGSISNTLTVKPNRPKTFEIAPTSPIGGSQHPMAAFSLDSISAHGQVVEIGNSNVAAADVPATVSVTPGYGNAIFTVTTKRVNVDSTTTISVTCNGGTLTQSITVLANYPVALVLQPNDVYGGTENSNGDITLRGEVGGVEQVVNLKSSSPSAAAVAASCSVAPGYYTRTFPITTSRVSADKSVTISAGCNGRTLTATLLVRANLISSITIDNPSVYGGAPVSAAVNIMHAAGGTGQVITLSSSNTAAATLPSLVTIPSQYTQKQFSISTKAVNSDQVVTISGKTLGVTSTATMTVKANRPVSVVIAPSSVIGGKSNPQGTVTLQGLAVINQTVALNSSNTAAATVPASVIVSGSYLSKDFIVTTKQVSADTTVTITATSQGGSAAGTAMVQAMHVDLFSISPAQVVGGHTANGALSLTASANASGQYVNVTSSNTSLAYLGGPVTVPPGGTSTNFNILTKPTKTAGTVTFTATLAGASKTATLRVMPPVLAGLTVTPNDLLGGAPFGVRLDLGDPAPAGLTASLTKASTYITLPTTVTFAAGATSLTISGATGSISVVQTTNITAKVGDVTLTAPITLRPGGVRSLTVTPGSVKGGIGATCRVTVAGVAPSGGLVVNIAGDAPIGAPATVTVPTGAIYKDFAITTSAVAATVVRIITASRANTSATASLTITP